jgi:hypothetical protein
MRSSIVAALTAAVWMASGCEQAAREPAAAVANPMPPKRKNARLSKLDIICSRCDLEIRPNIAGNAAPPSVQRDLPVGTRTAIDSIAANLETDR